jgi:hypothetical protein
VKAILIPENIAALVQKIDNPDGLCWSMECLDFDVPVTIVSYGYDSTWGLDAYVEQFSTNVQAFVPLSCLYIVGDEYV